MPFIHPQSPAPLSHLCMGEQNCPSCAFLALKILHHSGELSECKVSLVEGPHPVMEMLRLPLYPAPASMVADQNPCTLIIAHHHGALDITRPQEQKYIYWVVT